MFLEIRQWVRRIPRGKVSTYGDVALAAGFPRASRQVAWALKDAPPDLPWQRVIGKASAQRGKILLRGINGMEQVLQLQQEGVRVDGLFVDLARFGHEFTKEKGGRKSVPRKKATKRASRA
jgi:methylated-DNA-protein-cysteine methyltransferase related protein